MAKRLLVKIIELYQKTLSPDHGPMKSMHAQGYCKFRPTCSEYAKQAIEKHGAVKGVKLAARRVSRCHPWKEVTYDPIKQE